MAKVRKTHKVKWEEGQKKAAKKELKDYSSTSSFIEGDSIDHAKFGKGLVEACLGNKIEVRFEDKTRLLMQRVAV